MNRSDMIGCATRANSHGMRRTMLAVCPQKFWLMPSNRNMPRSTTWP
jgi:hypothetical protein